MVDVQVVGPEVERSGEVLTPEALQFVGTLQHLFGASRDELLPPHRPAGPDRRRRAAGLPAETADVRSGDWSVPPRPGLTRRRVEITGPTEPKMAINALNCGADVWLADLEDAKTPHWRNVVTGQLVLRDAVRGSLSFTSPEGKQYAVRPDAVLPTIVPRPRGWHLDERHVLVDGAPVVGALVDAGLYLFHNAQAQLDRGSGPYFYLPKMESHLEARLWADVFVHCERELGLPRGSIRCTMLIETIPAAFEMEELLYELREHATGLNAGAGTTCSAWSRSSGRRAAFVLPDRSAVTMTAPMMRAYTEQWSATCHRRGAMAIGGWPRRSRADATPRPTSAP